MPSVETVAAPSHRNPALDGIRGLAILCVFFYHYGGGLKSHNPVIHFYGILCSAGWIGVPMFFALSGFLITTILWETQQQHPRAPHRLRNFYIRRILRIFPLYYFALALAAIALLVVGGTWHDLRHLAPEAFFLLDVPHIFHTSAMVSPLPLFHFWTLAVEEQFYVLWPLLLLGCRTRRAAISLCVAAFFASFAFCVVVFAFPHLVSDATAGSLDQFLVTNLGALALGSLLSFLAQSRSGHRDETFAPLSSLALSSKPATSNRFHRFALLAFSIGIASFILTGILHGTFSLHTRVQYFTALPAIWLSSTALIPLVLRAGRLRTLFSNAALCFLGRISYGFYVFHILFEPFFNSIARHLTHATTDYPYFLVRLVAAFILSLLISSISFALLESPFLQLKRYFPSNPLPRSTV